MIQRIITGSIAVIIFLPIAYLGGIPFTILCYIMASLALFEILRMKKISIFSITGFLALLLLWVFLLPTEYSEFLLHIDVEKTEILFFGVLIFLSHSVLTKNRVSYDDIGFCIISVLYLGIGFYYMIETRFAGLTFFAFALILIWLTDSGAYFIGRAFGKKKLWPDISPNKTIEGSLGGILSAILVAIVFYYFTEIGNAISFVHLIIVSIIMSIFGQVGDLVESALKRFYHVKDSGKLLPGHGGMLDRVDSWLFVMPLLHFLNII